MTPEQFIAYKEANHQRVLDFVRTATGPVFVSDVVESMSPNMQEQKRRVDAVTGLGHDRPEVAA